MASIGRACHETGARWHWGAAGHRWRTGRHAGARRFPGGFGDSSGANDMAGGGFQGLVCLGQAAWSIPTLRWKRN